MPPLEVNIGGTWKTVSGIEVNVGGTWKTVSSVETNIAGTWKTAYTSGGGGGETRKLNTTVSPNSGLVQKTNTTHSQTSYTYGYGFDEGADPFGYFPDFGSITSNTYTDGNSNQQTVESCMSVYHTSSSQWILYFTLATTGIADSDAIFSKIVIDGVTFNRADRTAKANCTGGTYWRWADTQDRFTAASPTFEVWIDP